MKTSFDILVIDDAQIVLDAVRKICQFENLTIDTAIDGLAALEKIKSCKYNMILCDIMMPMMNGFEFLKEFRKDFPVTPLILTSGFSTNENAVKALSDGASNFIPKPFTFEELTGIIKSTLRYNSLNEIGTKASNTTTVHSNYVPCPPEYSRLGYLSWAKPESDGTALLGIINLAFEFIDQPAKIIQLQNDDKTFQGGSFVTILDREENENNILSPLSGSIVEANAKLIDNINLLGIDPYFEGWLYRIIPSNLEFEISKLVSCTSERT